MGIHAATGPAWRAAALHGGGWPLGLPGIILESTGAGADAQAAYVRRVLQYTDARPVDAPSGDGWCIWLSAGVRPTAPGWLHLIADAARRGSTVVAGMRDSWLAAAPGVAAGLGDAGWRTLFHRATRIRGVRMVVGNPEKLV